MMKMTINKEVKVIMMRNHFMSTSNTMNVRRSV